MFPKIQVYGKYREWKPKILLLAQQGPPRPVAFRPHLAMGFPFPVWNSRSPDRAETAPSGAGLAHFEGFLHLKPSIGVRELRRNKLD
jgi:hypothetical protein